MSLYRCQTPSSVVHHPIGPSDVTINASASPLWKSMWDGVGWPNRWPARSTRRQQAAIRASLADAPFRSSAPSGPRTARTLEVKRAALRRFGRVTRRPPVGQSSNVTPVPRRHFRPCGVSFREACHADRCSWAPKKKKNAISLKSVNFSPPGAESARLSGCRRRRPCDRAGLMREQ